MLSGAFFAQSDLNFLVCGFIGLIMKLPKLYRPIKIRFSSLRSGIGGGLGVIFDIDTIVEHVVTRVLCEDGWKWQIKNFNKIIEWDYSVETDQEILNEIGMNTDDISYT